MTTVTLLAGGTRRLIVILWQATSHMAPFKLAVALLSLGFSHFMFIQFMRLQASKPLAANAQQASAPTRDPTLVPPETVHIEKLVFTGEVKNLTISNAEGHYTLACNSGLDSCLTPNPGKDYLLFTKTTKWKSPEPRTMSRWIGYKIGR